jgi:1-acyl-sn-glycerol-3-phosphate acyltransferase
MVPEEFGKAMTDDDAEREQLLAQRDPAYVAKALPFLKLAMKRYFRSEVRNMERVPDGGVLMVGNHSGGLMPMDVPVIAVELFDTFGTDRPLYCLAHDMLFTGVNGPIMRKFGFVPAHRESAHAVLTSGAVTIVFPGGDYDSFRPTLKSSVIDFNGRTGYVRTAIKAGVPIVPVVSIGGQEAQFHLTRGEWLGRHSPLRRFMRSDLLPLAVGFPFGLMPAGLNIPLPTKILTQVLEPIHIEAEFGPDPDIAKVDEVVRSRMQDALDQLARERRFPVLG